jgi:phosphatidylserine/phosphatidylglycerophosphate/cardiolipin synthase-like enzyme
MGAEGFIHVKLYITDGSAYIGSANMTTASWARNIDVLYQIPREEALSLFNTLWSSARALAVIDLMSPGIHRG